MGVCHFQIRPVRGLPTHLYHVQVQSTYRMLTLNVIHLELKIQKYVYTHSCFPLRRYPLLPSEGIVEPIGLDYSCFQHVKNDGSNPPSPRNTKEYQRIRPPVNWPSTSSPVTTRTGCPNSRYTQRSRVTYWYVNYFAPFPRNVPLLFELAPLLS